jgi:hypothetical protein
MARIEGLDLKYAKAKEYKTKLVLVDGVRMLDVAHRSGERFLVNGERFLRATSADRSRQQAQQNQKEETK